MKLSRTQYRLVELALIILGLTLSIISMKSSKTRHNTTNPQSEVQTK